MVNVTAIMSKGPRIRKGSVLTDIKNTSVIEFDDISEDEMNKMIALKKKIAARMQSVIGIQPDIKIVEPRSLERSMGKAKHVIDNRKLV